MASNMMASKSRTGLTEASTSTTTHKHPIHAQSKVAKLIRGGSTKGPNRDPSPSHNTTNILGEKGMSMSMDSKINTGERRSIKITPRLSTPGSEKSSRPLKLSELQEQVTVAQEDLKKAKSQLEEIEKEKAEAVEELKDAKKMVGEANEKLEDAVSARRRAEEAWEIEKFRAIELEQTSIESIQKKEDEWKKKLEITQKQHSQDIAALVLTNKELEKAKIELAKAIDAKCAALNRAEEISKMAEENEKKVDTSNEEINRLEGLLAVELENKTKEVSKMAEEKERKVETLNEEINCLKGLLAVELEKKTKEVSKMSEENEKKVEALNEEINRLKRLLAVEIENRTKEASEIINKLEADAVEMRAELEKAKAAEKNLLSMEELVEGLKINVAYAKRAEVESSQKVEELKKRAEELENRVEELDECNRMRESSVVTMTKELEENSSILNVKESEICSLKKKVQLLEPELAKYREVAEKLEFRVDVAQKEVDHLRAKVESLEMKIQDLEEAKREAVNWERMAILKNESLLEERNKMSKEQEITKDELDSSKRAIGDLSSALREVEEAKREAVNRERMASLKIESLLEERNKMLKEQEIMKDELDNSKKAMGDLASALREVSSEAREAKERVLIKQTEIESFNSQISEISTFSSNVTQKYESQIEEANSEITRLRKAVEKMEIEAKSSKEEWYSKEIGFTNSIKKSEEQINSIRSEMNKAMQSLKGTEQELHVSREDKVLLHNKLRQVEAVLRESNSTAEVTRSEGLQLKEILSDKEGKLNCAIQEINELRVRETFTLAKIEELTALLAQANSRKVDEDDAARAAENSKVLLIKMELDKVMESLRVAEHEIQVARDDKSQLENKLRQIESKITEANLIAEEAKIDSLRLKEILSEKENELKSLARENDNLRQKEVAAQSKIDEMSVLLVELTTKKAEETNVRSNERQPSMLLKLMCSPLEKVRADEAEKDDRPKFEPIKTREIHDENKNREHANGKWKMVEESELAEGKRMENNGTALENHLAKDRDHHDATDHDTSDDEIDSNPEEIYEQTNGLLTNVPDNLHHHKKKKALLRKFGNLLKKKVTASR